MKRFCFVLGCSGLTTAWCGPAVALTLRRAPDLAGWAADAGAAAVAATWAQALLGLLAGWVSLGLLAAAVAALPGAAGRLGRGLAQRVLPAALYRVAAGAAGLGVVLAPVAAGASAPPPVPSPTLPLSPPSAAAVPAPALPTSAAPPLPATTVTVAPGDSLWRIAAEHLTGEPSGARIAAAWPRWYAANRAVIGPDPSRLLPGEVLRAPEGSR